MSLTGAHHGWPVLDCTALLAGLAVVRVPDVVAGFRMSGPDGSVSSTAEAAAVGLRNAAVPHGCPLV